MSTASPQLAIQIVNYKTKSFLYPLLKSIMHDLIGCGLAYEINIIDNNSGDDLSEIIKLWPTCQIFKSLSNGGFGAGHNQLAAKTKARYLLLLNPDTLIIEPNTLKRLYDVAQRLSADVVGPTLLTLKKRPKSLPLEGVTDVDSMLKPQKWDHGELKVTKVLGKPLFQPRFTVGNVAWVSGAVALIEHDAFDKVDGFDEKFFLYKEEEDLFLRMRRLSSKVIYDPSIRVLHYGSVVASKDVHFAKSKKYFGQKHGDVDAVL